MSTFAQRVQLGPFFSAGALNGAAQLWHYQAGTSTLKNIWSDRAMTTTLAQPFLADADGIFNFFADGLHKMVIKDAAGTTLYTLDNWQLLDQNASALTEGDPITSASTIVIGPEVYAHVTGSTNISTLSGTIPFFWAIFDGNLSLLHSSNLLLPGSRNRAMLAGDVALFLYEGSGAYRLAAHMQTEGAYVGRQGSTVASSATLSVPTDGDLLDISGTTTISAIATAGAGYRFRARFTGAGLNILYHAQSMQCPFEIDYRTSLNEVIEFVSLGAGNWLVIPQAGAPLLEPGTPFLWWGTAAPKGGVLCTGAALNCTVYGGLAQRLIPSAFTLGNVGTSLGTFTAVAATDQIDRVAHGLAVNDIVHVTNAGGALPAGLTANTPYYVKTVVSVDLITVSLSRGGATVDITDTGTGTHTIHNKVNAPDLRGKTWVGLDNLGGSSANIITDANADILGGMGGTEIIDTTRMPSHTHQERGSNAGTGGNTITRATLSSGDASTDTTTGSTGGGAPFNEPFMAGGYAIRF